MPLRFLDGSVDISLTMGLQQAAVEDPKGRLDVPRAYGMVSMHARNRLVIGGRFLPHSIAPNPWMH